MGAVHVVIVWILALKISYTIRRPEGQAQVVCNVRGLGLCPNMAIVPLVHTIHGFGFGSGYRGANGREYKDDITIKARR